jgi:hypothetical protein
LFFAVLEDWKPKMEVLANSAPHGGCHPGLQKGSKCPWKRREREKEKERKQERMQMTAHESVLVFLLIKAYKNHDRPILMTSSKPNYLPPNSHLQKLP